MRGMHAMHRSHIARYPIDRCATLLVRGGAVPTRFPIVPRGTFRNAEGGRPLGPPPSSLALGLPVEELFEGCHLPRPRCEEVHLLAVEQRAPEVCGGQGAGRGPVEPLRQEGAVASETLCDEGGLLAIREGGEQRRFLPRHRGLGLRPSGEGMGSGGLREGGCGGGRGGEGGGGGGHGGGVFLATDCREPLGAEGATRPAPSLFGHGENTFRNF